MVGIALLVVVVVVAVLVMRNAKDNGGRDGRSTVRTARPSRGGPEGGDLERWVAAELISAEQAEAIEAYERAQAAAPQAPRPEGERPKVPVVAEAIGYLGGTLALAGVVLVILNSWSDLAVGGRLGIALFGAVAFGVAGAAVPEGRDPALDRLRAFLWVLSPAALAVAVGVVAEDRGAGEQAVVTWSALAMAVHSSALWRWRDRPAQQFVGLVATTVAVAAGLEMAVGPTVAGGAVMAVGAVELYAGVARRTPAPAVTELVGAGTLLAGAGMIVAEAPAAGLPAVVAVGLLLLGLVASPALDLRRADRLALAVPGTLALVQGVPSTLGYFAMEAGAVTGLVTALVGAALIVVAGRGRTRAPQVVEAVGGLVMLGGAALTGTQWDDAAPVLGVLTAVGLVGLGMLPDRVLLSLIGALGLLINVPWAIGRLFPGEGRVPLLITVAGVLLVVVAVLLTRQGDRFRRLGAERHRGPGAPHPVA